MSSVTIPGATIARTTLVDAAGKVPQKAEWVVVDGKLTPMTFLQQLDRFEGTTIGNVAESAAARVGKLEARVSRDRMIGWAGVGVTVAGALVAALTPFKGVGIGIAAVGLAGGANWGFTSAKWDNDEIASTQEFVEDLGQWGTILSQGQTATAPPAPTPVVSLT